MAWAQLNYTKGQIEAAGKALVVHGVYDVSDEDIETINNWRACHAYPLYLFRQGLKRACSKIDSESIIAQRLKRLRSIAKKLHRMPHMGLNTMQDIGGCRAVVGSIGKLAELIPVVRAECGEHELLPPRDYVYKPKDDGYRGAHLVYRYHCDKSDARNGLRIEIQLRSALQHAWATTVEIVDTFTHQDLKSGVGDAGWKRFFALMGSVCALWEGTPPVPGTPGPEMELRSELSECAEKLKVDVLLGSFSFALKISQKYDRFSKMFLLDLDPAKEAMEIRGYTGSREAAKAYLSAERDRSREASQIVLASAESMRSIHGAYPNYFADSTTFLNVMREFLGTALVP